MEGVPWAIMHEATGAQISALGTPCKYDYSGSAAWTASPSYPGPVTEDGVIFAYEDGANNTFDDMVFFASGVTLTLPERLTIASNRAADTLAAGSDLRLWLTVKDNEGNTFGSAGDMVSWKLTPTNPSTANPGLVTASPPRLGDTVAFAATRAYESFTIEATYTFTDTLSGISVTLTAEKVVHTVPGTLTHLSIESAVPVPPTQLSTTPAANLQNDTPVDSLFLNPTSPQATVYAILRDAYGNFVEAARAPLWASTSAAVAAVAPAAGSGSATVTAAPCRGGGPVQTATVRASWNGLADDVAVQVTFEPGGRLVRAYTTDANANGYIDAVVCVFDAPVAVSDIETALAAQTLHISFGTRELAITAVAPRLAVVADSVFVISVSESTSGPRQSDWTPTVNFGPLPGLDPSAAAAVAADSIAPVVVEAVYAVGRCDLARGGFYP